MYKRMIKNARLEPARYQLTEEQLNQFDKLIQHLEAQFEGYIYSVRRRRKQKT